MSMGALPFRALALWLGVLTFVSLLNTVRVLGAHEYDSEGAIPSRHGQLSDSIDTPGGPWTELWAPVGLRYHALHHYFPGIPYHNLGAAYRRIVADASARCGIPRIDEPRLPPVAGCSLQQSDACRSRCSGRWWMTHFGIISPPVPGHIHPFAALGRELIARGHRVTYLQMIDLEEKIRAEGLDFEADRSDRSPTRLAAGIA